MILVHLKLAQVWYLFCINDAYSAGLTTVWPMQFFNVRFWDELYTVN